MGLTTRTVWRSSVFLYDSFLKSTTVGSRTYNYITIPTRHIQLSSIRNSRAECSQYMEQHINYHSRFSSPNLFATNVRAMRYDHLPRMISSSTSCKIRQTSEIYHSSNSNDGNSVNSNKVNNDTKISKDSNNDDANKGYSKSGYKKIDWGDIARITVPLTLVALGFYFTVNNQFVVLESVRSKTETPIVGDEKDQLALHEVRTLPRWLNLAVVWLPILVLYPIWYLTWKVYLLVSRNVFRYQLDRSRRAPILIRWWISLLVAGLERSGVLFIKLGQWASTRADLFEPEICAELSRLQSFVAPHSFEYSLDEICRMFDYIPNGEFVRYESSRLQLRRIDEVPLGVGSIAQVHYAELTSGIPLAIKVTHPNVRENVVFDLAIMKQMVTFLSKITGSRVSVSREFNTFARMMLAQVDLTTEALNLTAFRDNFKQRGLFSVQKGNVSCIDFPQPLRATEHILAETYHDGTLLSSFLKFGPTSIDDLIGKNGFEAVLKMVFDDNFTHADLHPGNVLVEFRRKKPSFWRRSLDAFGRKDHIQSDAQCLADLNKDLRLAKTRQSFRDALFKLTSNLEYEPHIVILDAGLVNRLSMTSLGFLKRVLKASLEFDSMRVTHELVDIAGINMEEAPKLNGDVVALMRDVQQRLSKGVNTTLPLSVLSDAAVTRRTVELMRRHGVRLGSDLSGLLMTALCLDGVGKQLSPSMDVLNPVLDRL